MNKILKVVLSVAVVIAVAGGYVFPVSKASFGAVSSPEINSPFLSVNGVQHEYRRIGLAQATTTPCAVKSPASTSTLLFANVNITTATSTATTWTVAKASTAFATTTPLTGNYSLSSGVNGSMIYVASSTTSIVDSAQIFAPNTWLVWGVAGIGNPSSGKLLGTCQAEFLVH